jgi:hypothetical protein
MEAFDRKNLEIEDNWIYKEVGYKDSELIACFIKNIGASEISGHPKLNDLIYLTISYDPANAGIYNFCHCPNQNSQILSF